MKTMWYVALPVSRRLRCKLLLSYKFTDPAEEVQERILHWEPDALIMVENPEQAAASNPEDAKSDGDTQEPSPPLTENDVLTTAAEGIVQKPLPRDVMQIKI